MDFRTVLLWLPLAIGLVASGSAWWHFYRSDTAEPSLKVLSRALEAFAVVIFSLLVSDFSVVPFWSWWISATILTAAFGCMVVRWPRLAAAPEPPRRRGILPAAALRFSLTLIVCALLAVVASW